MVVMRVLDDGALTTAALRFRFEGPFDEALLELEFIPSCEIILSLRLLNAANSFAKV